MIHTYIAYAPKNHPNNLGWAYRNFMDKIDNENDWVCFLDHDATFTTKNWYTQLEDIVEKFSDYGLFTCMTNRVGNNYQIPQSIDKNNHNIIYHRAIGKKLQDTFYDSLTDYSVMDKTLLSGHFMLVKKKTWNIINGCTNGFLGVDNDIHKRCIDKGIKVGIMNGVYVYHWYRADKEPKVQTEMKEHYKTDFTKLNNFYAKHNLHS